MYNHHHSREDSNAANLPVFLIFLCYDISGICTTPCVWCGRTCLFELMASPMRKSPLSRWTCYSDSVFFFWRLWQKKKQEWSCYYISSFFHTLRRLFQTAFALSKYRPCVKVLFISCMCHCIAFLLALRTSRLWASTSIMFQHISAYRCR